MNDIRQLIMNVGQVIEMLSEFNPNDDLLIFSSSHKLGHITGLDKEMMLQKGAVVLTYDYDEVIREKVSIEEGINRQIEQLEELKNTIDRKAIHANINKAKDRALKVAAKARAKERKKPGKYKKKSIEQLLMEGLVPPIGRGRPRKIDINLFSPGIQDKFKPSRIKKMTPSELYKFVDDIRNEIKERSL